MLTVLLLSGETAAAGTADSPESDYDGYLLATPQIDNPLRPLQHARVAPGKIEIHAAVVSVADPLETHLARMFDIQVASIMRAFHASGYVLDGYAFTWDPNLAKGLETGSRLPQEGTRTFNADQREMPGLLLFRSDRWRDPKTLDGIGVTYVALFLVGESPTFGLQPKAFDRAAKCAVALNRQDKFPENLPLDSDCTSLFMHLFPDEQKSGAAVEPRDPITATEDKPGLEVIGPTFSGSMQSLALGLGKIPGIARFDVQVTSPSATVKSNDEINFWTGDRNGGSEAAGDYVYRSLATTLEQQLRALCKDIHPISTRCESKETVGCDQDPDDEIVILAEESTFGRGVFDIVDDWSKSADSADQLCAERIRVTQFPQNIAAIRAEHSRLDRAESAALKKLTGASGRLLELDLSTMDETADRPPPYNRALSTRSDELMLYGAFDAVKAWVDPVAVAIVATDVRDRLFLLNEVRKNLPRALPVLMELDFLTAHPDYRKISRGSVVIPNGDTRLRLDMGNDFCVLGEKQWTDRTAYYMFPSDYSANIFRAALGLKEVFEGDEEHRHGYCAQDSEIGVDAQQDKTELQPPSILVTTLAGFQELSDAGSFSRLFSNLWKVVATRNTKSQDRDTPRSMLLAADSRLYLETPIYLGLSALGLLLCVIARWILIHGRGLTILLRPLTRVDSTTVNPEATSDGDGPIADARQARWAQWAPRALGAAAVGLFLIAGLRLVPALHLETRDLTWDLPHGRDEWALACLFLFYVAVAITGYWRLYLWRIRYDEFFWTSGTARPGGDLHRDFPKIGKLELMAWLLVSATLILSVLTGIIKVPTSVDSLLPSAAISMLLLPAGAWFLFEFWKQWSNWTRLAMDLGKIMDRVSLKTTGKESAAPGGWPSPLGFGECPQSPFSLRFRRQDLYALMDAPGYAAWREQTHKVQDGAEWPFGNGMSTDFLLWQARLVAEMRLASVAVRTCAWNAILAPTVVLIGMAVYPAPWERLQTIFSVGLIIASFMAVMYVVLRLERHPLLSRMFTLHGDRLSLGGALSALWPKLIAAVVILVPVLFPNFLGWLYELLRSINSLK